MGYFRYFYSNNKTKYFSVPYFQRGLSQRLSWGGGHLSALWHQDLWLADALCLYWEQGQSSYPGWWQHYPSPCLCCLSQGINMLLFLILLVFKDIFSLDWWSGGCLCELFTWKHEQGHSDKSVILSSWRRPHFKVSSDESSSNKYSLSKDSEIYSSSFLIAWC